MSVNLDLPPEVEAGLLAQAQTRGLSLEAYLEQLAQGVSKNAAAAARLFGETQKEPAGRPFKTGRGTFAKYGTAPTVEDIAANRADMFRNFANLSK